MKLVEYPDREMMMIDLANVLASELKNSLFDHDTASFAVPGGTTPAPIFDTLCAASVDWDRVHVMLTDERCVAPDHPRSNEGLLRRHLMVERAASAKWTPIYQGDASDAGLARAGEDLAGALPISVLLLGMGADGHTASLFPGADRLADALAPDAPPLMALTAPGADEPRVSLTAPVLTGAMSTHVVITGPEKRATLERAADMSLEDAPIRVVWANATVHWAE
jgi:6-phosphogluconolactonase